MITAPTHPLAHLLGLPLAPSPRVKVQPRRSAPVPVSPVTVAPPVAVASPFAHLASTGIALLPIDSDVAGTIQTSKEIAARIVRAGAARRGKTQGGSALNLSTEAGRKAAQILAAGEMRRGEFVKGPDRSTPVGRLAEAIILAGKKRRGET